MTAIAFDRAPFAPSSRSRLAGRILTGLVAILLALDAGVKLALSREAVQGTVQLGFQAHHLLPIGLIALGCLILYLIPRTAPLGAVLWTGYFGGAVATQLRMDNPLFTYILAPVYMGALLWIALYLRDPRVRALLRPVR
jgi:hypothetical protein